MSSMTATASQPRYTTKSDAFFASAALCPPPRPPQGILSALGSGQRRSSEPAAPLPFCSTSKLPPPKLAQQPHTFLYSCSTPLPPPSWSSTPRRKSEGQLPSLAIDVTNNARRGSTSSNGSSVLGASAPSATTPTQERNSIEARLEAAVHELWSKSEASVEDGRTYGAIEDEANDPSSSTQIDEEDGSGADDDMYNDVPQESDNFITFVPRFPLQALDILYVPSHRSERHLKRVLCSSTPLARARSYQRRKVDFADFVEVIDTFAGIDYPGRRGPPPLEKLSMRDMLELRQIKLELCPPKIPDEPSATVPRQEALSAEDDSNAPACQTGKESCSDLLVPLTSLQPQYSPSPASSYLPGSTTMSISTSASSSLASSAQSDPFALPARLALSRDSSPDSSVLASVFSSPALSLSCSPSTSESDFGVFEDDENVMGSVFGPSKAVGGYFEAEGERSSKREDREDRQKGSLESTPLSKGSSGSKNDVYFKVSFAAPVPPPRLQVTPSTSLQEGAAVDTSLRPRSGSKPQSIFETVPMAQPSGPWGLQAQAAN